MHPILIRNNSSSFIVLKAFSKSIEIKPMYFPDSRIKKKIVNNDKQEFFENDLQSHS